MRSKLWITAFAALLVTGSYEVFLRTAQPGGDSGQDQFATNRIRLENYVDQNHAVDGVVVGSSLTARISIDAWPSGWRVLSQAGGSALTGLEVIDAVGAKPRAVLVEINTLDIEQRSGDAQSVVAPARRMLRQLLWFTRTANRPANLLVSAMRQNKDVPAIERPLPDFSSQLGQHRLEYDKKPGPSLPQNLRQVKGMVDKLRREGVQVIFFEMPVDQSLQNLVRARRIRSASLSMFPPHAYCWRAVGGVQKWSTMDGIHLLAQDGRKAASAILAAPCRAPGMNR